MTRLRALSAGHSSGTWASGDQAAQLLANPAHGAARVGLDILGELVDRGADRDFELGGQQHVIVVACRTWK